jgi:hypothetical protein
MSDSGLNHKVYTWAHSQVGQHLKGECWDFANLALKHAGAESNAGGGDAVNYEWGEPVGLHQVIAGDILQFRDHVVTEVTTTDITFDDGSGGVRTHRLPHHRPHHTAIVAAYKPPNSIVVFELHVKPDLHRVKENTVALANSLPVVETTFRNEKDKNGKMQRAKVITTKWVEVSGQIWAYRPKPKKQ